MPSVYQLITGDQWQSMPTFLWYQIERFCQYHSLDVSLLLSTLCKAVSRSIWPAIVLHATIDIAQFVLGAFFMLK